MPGHTQAQSGGGGAHAAISAEFRSNVEAKERLEWRRRRGWSETPAVLSLQLSRSSM